MEWHLRGCLRPNFPRDGWYEGALRSLERPAAPSAPHLWIVVNSLPARPYDPLPHPQVFENILFRKASQSRPRTFKLPLVEQRPTPDWVVPQPEMKDQMPLGVLCRPHPVIPCGDVAPRVRPEDCTHLWRAYSVVALPPSPSLCALG